MYFMFLNIQYFIPNPFCNIFLWGMRNLYGLCFHPNAMYEYRFNAFIYCVPAKGLKKLK